MLYCNSIILSKYIVGKCYRDNKPISNLQLNKILYIIQSVYCRATNGKLLFLENFEAWPFGPILPDIYRLFSKYGGDIIDEYYDIDTFGMNNEVKDFIDEGIEILRDLSPWDLVRTINAPGSPWYITYKNGDGYKQIIKNKLIIETSLKNM